jgi:hypothetical protein
VIAGIDYSTRAVDVVLLDEDTDAATWHRFELKGADAFDRARDVHRAFNFTSEIWDEIIAIGIEEPQATGPRRANIGALFRVQGAILANLPWNRLVQPLYPTQWRKTVGLPGNASKDEVKMWVTALWDNALDRYDWPQDACDAYCIALATRTLIQKVAA